MINEFSCILLATIGFSLSHAILNFVTYAKNANYESVIISLFSAGTSTLVLYVNVQAPDVALTEAAIGTFFGAIISSKTLIPLMRANATQTKEVKSKEKNRIELLTSAGISILMSLVFAHILDLEFGNETSYHNCSRAAKYYKSSFSSIGIKNLVTAILGYFRGFDTMLETSVIFSGALAIIHILLPDNANNKSSFKSKISSNTARPTAIEIGYAYFIGHVIAIFALYLHICGDDIPGGGFQAGSMLAGLYLYLESQNLIQKIAISKAIRFSAIGCMIYVVIGIICYILGGEFLEYTLLAKEKERAIWIGLFAVETGVCIGVCSAFIGIYHAIEKFRRENANL